MYRMDREKLLPTMFNALSLTIKTNPNQIPPAPPPKSQIPPLRMSIL